MIALVLAVAPLAAALSSTLTSAQAEVRETQRRLELLEAEQAWWRANEARLRATTCGPGRLWVPTFDSDAEFYRGSPEVLSEVPPIEGATAYAGYCIPDPVAERQRSEDFLRQVQDERARRDIGRIEEAFARLVAEGKSPETAAAEVRQTFAPLIPYFERYAKLGHFASFDANVLLARTSDRVNTIRAEIGVPKPAAVPPVVRRLRIERAPSGEYGGVPTKRPGLLETGAAIALLSAPFWVPRVFK